VGNYLLQIIVDKVEILLLEELHMSRGATAIAVTAH
jgi:hypothetical protein